MRSDHGRGTVRRLDEPTTALLGVGCSDPFGTAAAVRLYCLQAAEHLRVSGGRPGHPLTPLLAEEVASTMRYAHRCLLSLPAQLLLEPLVLKAIREVRTALDAQG